MNKKHKNLEYLKQQREKLDKEIKGLEESEKAKETLIIEGFEITKPKICKTYEEAKNCPKGFRLPIRWELFKILEKIENRKKLSDGGYMFFWSSLIENNYSKGLYLDGNLNVNSNGGNLAYSYDGGRVVWIKENK